MSIAPTRQSLSAARREEKESAAFRDTSVQYNAVVEGKT